MIKERQNKDHIHSWIHRIDKQKSSLLSRVLSVHPLEGRMVMSLKACARNLRASATHSCERNGVVVETQRDTLPSLMCHIFPWALDGKKKVDRLGMPIHVILHQMHVKRFWVQC